MAFYIIVVLRLGGERLERVMKTNDLIGEPGALYYGVMCNNRRYMGFDAVPLGDEENDDSGIEVDQDSAASGNEEHRSLDDFD